MIVSVVASMAPAVAQDEGDPAPSQAEVELAERYSPVFMLKQQSEPCDTDGEAFAPMSVDVVLDNPDVLLRQAGVGDPVVTRQPVGADLFGRGEGFFLDFNGLTLEPGCVYERDYQRYTGGESVVYARVVQQPDEPGFVALQYWLYWYYNDWNNKHESDWEFIQLLFSAPSVAAALQTEPVSIGYAQHEGGEVAAWDSSKLRRQGSHPVVFSSAGSHASYFEPLVFLGRRGTEGFGCDTTTGPSREVAPTVVVLPDQVTSPDSPFAWLEFSGRWGERQSGAFNGPTGPVGKDRWTHPVDWHDHLRSKSVSIPGGDEANAATLSSFCSVVDWGSNQLRVALVSPTRLLATVALGALALWLLASRTVWTRCAPTPLRERRCVGQMLRVAAGSYWTSRGAIAGFALAFVPFAALLGLVGSFAPFGVAQALAGLFSAVLYVAIVALVTAYWHLAGSGGSRLFRSSVATAWSRRRAVAATSLRVYVLVTLMVISIIGLPFAIWFGVRWQFSVSVATVEGLKGRAALQRSAQLVEGRWWRTAITGGLLTGIAALLNSGFQLLLLIGLAGMPLWLYTAVAFLITGLVIPMAATAPVLLYGDAAAVHQEATQRESAGSEPTMVS